MRRALFKDLKPELTRLAGVTGFGTTDARFLLAFNRATEELMNEGDFPGVVDRYRFNAFDGAIALPGDLERIMAISANASPIEMRAPWYEFDQFGPGEQIGMTGVDVGIDRGERPTFRTLPAGSEDFIRVYCEADETEDDVRPVITIRGYDKYGEWVRSVVGGAWIDGIQVELNGDAAPYFVQTPFQWSEIESVFKPETKGYVRLWAYNATTGIETHLSNYAPRETRPSYRTYAFPSLSQTSTTQVTARCRRRFVPIVHDDDWVIISNMAAMELAMRAIVKREGDDLGGYLQSMEAAALVLSKEALSYHGKTQRPGMTFSSSFGFGNFPGVR